MMNYAVQPVVCLNGTWTVDDETLAAVYLALKADGTAENISGPSVDDEHGFVAFMHRDDVHPLLMLADGKVGGIAWLSHVTGHSAWTHFAMLRWAYRHHTLGLAQAATAYWDSFEVEGVPFLRVLMGATPKRLPKAVAFAKRVGFNVIGEVPYIDDGAHPVVMTYRVNARLNHG
jgi:hypothetical protein